MYNANVIHGGSLAPPLGGGGRNAPGQLAEEQRQEHRRRELPHYPGRVHGGRRTCLEMEVKIHPYNVLKKIVSAAAILDGMTKYLRITGLS